MWVVFEKTKAGNQITLKMTAVTAPMNFFIFYFLGEVGWGDDLSVSLVSCFEIALFHIIIFINFNFLYLQFFQTVNFQKVKK